MNTRFFIKQSVSQSPEGLSVPPGAPRKKARSGCLRVFSMVILAAFVIPVSADSADKLIVKDGLDNVTFCVQDDGSTAVGKTTPNFPLDVSGPVDPVRVVGGEVGADLLPGVPPVRGAKDHLGPGVDHRRILG